jgi:type IV pilus assembly protein PilM
MANSNTAWGIEVGAFAIKAIRLERDGDRVSVSDFAVIPHKKVLSTPDLDQNEMIRLGLGQFISQKAIEGETLVISIPGHSAFARFAKLPPVEPKKVPDIVKFEAVQQIPFPIEEVEWDYETFLRPDSPEVEVGIFAITRERVQQRLGLYGELGITPEALTLSPVAVYNAMAYDHDLESRKMALIYLDIGTNATDLIVANEGSCWIRTFPLGGTHFTEAIANSFKLSYSKAEKLKQEASTSKYAKQIMQAMRPVFTDLLQDIQRSLGYYQSVHREVELKTMVGLGSTFKIPGLRKFLGQQLQMDVVRLDEFRKLRVEGREAAAFAENAVNMATAYGLALQGVGLAKIDVNLVPVPVLRNQIWHGKIKWFAAAAAIAIAGGAITFYRPISDSNALQGEGPTVVHDVIRQGRLVSDQFKQTLDRHNAVGYTAENVRRLLDYRTAWPYIVNDAAHALASADPQAELLGADIESMLTIDPGERRLIELLKLDGDYAYVVGEAPQGQAPAAGKRYINVRMHVRLTHDDPVGFLNQTVESWLRQNSEPVGQRANVPYRIVTSDVPTFINAETMVTGRTDAEGAITDETDRRQASRPSDPTTPNRPARPGGGGSDNPGGQGTGLDIEDPPPPPPGGFNQPPPSGPRPGGGGSGSGGPLPGGGGSGTGSGGQQGAPTQPGGPPRGGPPQGGAEDEPNLRDLSLEDLNALAPVPKAPQSLPPDTPFYETVIEFTVELLDPKFDNAADEATARGGSADGSANS